MPEGDAEHDAREEHPAAPRDALRPRGLIADEQGRDADAEQQHERQRQRALDEDRDAERGEERAERPGERQRRAAQPERAGDGRAGCKHDRGREREADQRHRSSSAGTCSGAEPARDVAVLAAALAPEYEAAEEEGRAEQAARALGVGEAAVLRQEAEVAAHVLAQQPSAVRGTADMDALGAGEEERLPAVLGEPVRPVGLLAEEEERLVERADLLHSGAPHEHARTHHEVRLASAVVGEATRVEAVQELGARRELPEEEVLGGEPPERREAADGALERPVGIEQPRADDRGLGVLLGEGDEPLERAGREPRVRVQDQRVRLGEGRHAGIPAGGEAEVLLLDQLHVGEAGPDEVDRAVGRAVVDDDGLDTAHALEALLQPGQRVVGDDDNAGLRHASRSAVRGGPPTTGSRRRAPPSSSRRGRRGSPRRRPGRRRRRRCRGS